jgi:hypothetical protein
MRYGKRFVDQIWIKQRMDHADDRRNAELRRRFPVDVVPFVEILMSPADPDAPLTPVVDVVLEPKPQDVP